MGSMGVDMSTVTLQEAAVQLSAGAVGVIPTDTVYGIVAAARNQAAVDRLFCVKPREGKPGTVIAADIEQLLDLGVRRRDVELVESEWPAPLSVIVPLADSMVYLHRGVGSVAVRIPDDEPLRQALKISGPLMTSSANMPGEVTAQTVAEARAYFGETVDFYVDGGSLAHAQPSKIVRRVGDTLERLR